MPAQELLSEADQLKKVSARLEALADLHPVVTEALLKIAETVLSTATLLDGAARRLTSSINVSTLPPGCRTCCCSM